ncbi:zinc finger protein 830 [Myxocyprinus asiaticus]|uniref:zinc finger protein 830 n=1 Tax=Myxocyprinus asiaticus TaxID=70543 RepID=UPI0022224709|nr:zinc finger protein 830 [Myxocyprinus asiaticus]
MSSLCSTLMTSFSRVKMASVKKGKKVVNQDELRRLMREKKLSSERQKRVESPYAKYNSVGHLSCVLCNVQVKSELLWQTHVLGKQHRDKVNELKTKSSSSSSSMLKREAPADTSSSSSSSSVKRVKLQDAAGVTAKLQEGKAASSHRSAGLGLLAGHYDDDDDEDMDTSSKTPAEDSVPAAATGALPADFFDSSVHGVSHSGSVSKAGDDGETVAAEKKDNTAEALPEGFFDDPVRDAKVRNVDTPKDQLDKEWEEFQKEMRQVNSASDAIVAEDDEEGRLERQIDEIDEQIECFRRVEVLRAKQEVVKSTITKEKWRRDETQQSGSDEEDEEELMHVLTQDWRAKGALA